MKKLLKIKMENDKVDGEISSHDEGQVVYFGIGSVPTVCYFIFFLQNVILIFIIQVVEKMEMEKKEREEIESQKIMDLRAENVGLKKKIKDLTADIACEKNTTRHQQTDKKYLTQRNIEFAAAVKYKDDYIRRLEQKINALNCHWYGRSHKKYSK